MEKSDKLKNFLNKEEEVKNPYFTFDNEDEKTITGKDGLIERVDVKFVTKDGKQLLREQDFERN